MTAQETRSRAEDFYYHYLYVAVATPTGAIVRVWRSEKHGERRSKYLGSYFSQTRTVPPRSAYNAGINGRHERNRA